MNLPDKRREWLQKAYNGELTMNGLELLMSQRHEIYLQKRKEEPIKKEVEA